MVTEEDDSGLEWEELAGWTEDIFSPNFGAAPQREPALRDQEFWSSPGNIDMIPPNYLDWINKFQQRVLEGYNSAFTRLASPETPAPERLNIFDSKLYADLESLLSDVSAAKIGRKDLEFVSMLVGLNPTPLEASLVEETGNLDLEDL